MDLNINNTITTFCRCCFKASTDVENLFDMKIVAFDFVENQTTTYFKAYLETSGCCAMRLMEISDDSYMICLKCATQLELAYTFRAKCISVMDELERRFSLQQVHAEQHTIEVTDGESGSKIEFEVINDESQDSEAEHFVLLEVEGEQLVVPMSETAKQPEPAPIVDKSVDFAATVGDYNCKFCPKNFLQEEDFRQHCFEAHQKIVLRCQPCNIIFSDKSSYQRHKNLSHCESRLACKHCDNVFMSCAELENHNRVHHKVELRYQCPECDRQFAFGSNIWSHSFSHRDHNLLPFKCPKCRFMTAKLRHFKGHIKNTHKISYNEKRFGYQELARKSTASLLKSSEVYIRAARKK